tara:strand:- start:457 stop:867 length:411 start_codon:yes stop_codon:yes gene_type:complete
MPARLRLKMDWLIYILIGAGSAGAGSGITAWLMGKKEPIVVKEEVAKEQIQVQKNLTQPDLLKEPCSKDYIKENGESLCRELFCRMTTRGIDSKTSGAECESISNTINKLVILKACDKKETAEEKRSCIEFFDRRM